MINIKNIKRLSTIILAVIAIASIAFYWISEVPKRALEKQILAMNGMAINLDFAEAEAIYDGCDSTYQSSNVRKLVLFVDSTSCTNCFLSRLVRYYHINDSLVAHNGEMLVVLHPQNGQQEEIKTRLVNIGFPFWCIVDSAGVFVKNNRGIPNNKSLHIFSLDEQDKVILVGDPTKNKRIRELFLREVLKQHMEAIQLPHQYASDSLSKKTR